MIEKLEGDNCFPLCAEAEKGKTQGRFSLPFADKTQRDRSLWPLGVTPSDWKGRRINHEYHMSSFRRQLKRYGKLIIAPEETKKHFHGKCS